MTYELSGAGYLLSATGYASSIPVAGGTGTIEDWESTTISTDYRGDTGAWSTQTSVVKEGSTAGRCSNATANRYAIFNDTSAQTVTQDVTYRCWVNAGDSNLFMGPCVFVDPSSTDSTDWTGYFVWLDSSTSEGAHLEYFVNGSYDSSVCDVAFDLAYDTWYELEWHSESGTNSWSFEVFDASGVSQGSDTGTHSSRTSGDWGFMYRNLSAVSRVGDFDHWRSV